MEWLTADWERNNSLAAKVKLPVRANVTNARNCLLSIGELIYESLSSGSLKQSGLSIPVTTKLWHVYG